MLSAVLSLLWMAAAAAPAPVRAERVVGEVSAVEDGRLTVLAPGGASIVLTADAATRCVRTKPGAATLEGASPIAIGDVAVGDRVLAAGTLSADGSLSARQVVVMSRGDIAGRQQRDRDEWRQRGTGGVVKAVDPEKQEIALDVRGSKVPVIVSITEKKAAFRRYASDSVRFDDARPSALSEVQVGDQVRVLGDRSEDGTRITAEHVVSGAFRTIVGTVEGIDAENGEMRITAGTPPEKLSVAVSREALTRRLGPEQVKAVKGGANLADLLDRMPPLSIAELKAGDRVALSSARGAGEARVTAVVVVAGIEPLLAPAAPGRPGGATLMPGLPGGALDMGVGGP